MDEPTSFEGTLACNLEFGQALEICAKVQNTGTWFNIILVNKNSKDDDPQINVGLQMLVNLNENKISFQTGHIELQEELNDNFPTTLFYEKFKVNIVMGEEFFHIAINNKAYTRISYSVPLNTLNFIKVTGDLEFIKQMDHRRYLPYVWPPHQLEDEKACFTNDQPLSFKPGHVMVINAQMDGNAHGKLIVQLKNAHDMEREELHICARLEVKKLIRNSKTVRMTDKHTGISYYGFGIEETGGEYTFRNFLPPFNLALAFTPTEIYIAKDGKFLYRFLYRTKNVLKDLMGVRIRGKSGVNVRVNSVDHIQMEDPECSGFEEYSKLTKVWEFKY